MINLIMRRLLWMIPTLIAISFVSFALWPLVISPHHMLVLSHYALTASGRPLLPLCFSGSGFVPIGRSRSPTR